MSGSAANPSLAIVYALFGDAGAARDTARRIVEEKLAACANILAPCTSIYPWEGKIEENAEVPVLFKTRAELRDSLMARLAQLHAYDVPAILSWSIDAAHAPYAAWVCDETVRP